MSIGVYSTTGYGGFSNAQLTKDCGTIPYLLHKIYGYDAVLFGEERGDYPNRRYVPEMRLDFWLRDKTPYVIRQCDYISKNFQNMDAFFMIGAYRTYIPMIKLYRKLRPDGKVYLALDASSYWIDSIRWNDPDFLEFIKSCDVIAASCRAMQRYVARKWPVIVNYIPNGFYNYGGADMTVDFSKKENIILTVGRIGTKEKKSELLLNAFAMVANRLPSWRLRFVGSVETSFLNYTAKVFVRYPALSKRVEFAGPILDRAALMEEYKRAKIFALTSSSEGTPNVLAEALFGGCYIITSNIDAAEDMTDGGRCGGIFRDGNEFLSVLVSAANDDEKLLRGGKHALEYGRKVFDFEKIVRRVHYLLFEEA